MDQRTVKDKGEEGEHHLLKEGGQNQIITRYINSFSFIRSVSKQAATGCVYLDPPSFPVKLETRLLVSVFELPK